jgi:hypothetical protein
MAWCLIKYRDNFTFTCFYFNILQQIMNHSYPYFAVRPSVTAKWTWKLLLLTLVHDQSHNKRVPSAFPLRQRTISIQLGFYIAYKLHFNNGPQLNGKQRAEEPSVCKIYNEALKFIVYIKIETVRLSGVYYVYQWRPHNCTFQFSSWYITRI